MRRFMTVAAAAAAIAGLVAINSAEAGNRGNPGQTKGRSTSDRRYEESHGVKFSHGYFYEGRDHHHWSSHCYWDKYGCECYYCPYQSCWYYWCEPKCCYYPVSYILEQPPVPVPAPTVVTQATATATASAAVTQIVAPSGGEGLPTTGPDGRPFKR